MATVTWTSTEPTVDEWLQESTTGEYTYYVAQGRPGAGYWFSRIIFSVGRITGTRDIAIKAVCQGHKQNGWVNQPTWVTAIVTVDGIDYEADPCGKDSNSATSYGADGAQLGTRYAIISALANGAAIPCRSKSGGTGVTLTNPITAPAFRIKVSGTWTDANEVYANVNGAWTEVGAAYVKDGTWKELQ